MILAHDVMVTHPLFAIPAILTVLVLALIVLISLFRGTESWRIRRLEKAMDRVFNKWR
jgi:hypothetical protein